MPSVFESVTGLLAQGDTMSRLGGAIGTDPSNTQRAVQAAAPALLGGMADRVEQPGGLQAITKLLDRTDASPEAGVDAMLRSDGSQGRGMLDDLFGADHGDLFSGLASKASVSSGSMARLVPMLAPMVMGLLAKRRSAEQLSPDGLIGLLQGERQEMRRTGLLDAGAVGAGVAGAGAIAGAGAAGAAAVGATAGRVNAPVRERPMVPSPDEPSGGRFGWLKWLIGAIVLVALLAWALSQCSGSEELSDVTEAVGDVADDAEVITDEVEDLAEEVTDAADEAVDAVSGVDLQPDVDAAVSGVGIAGLAGVIDADGVVTLSGEVADDDAKAAAEAAVVGVEGVTSVNNDIIVAAPEAGDAEAASADENTDTDEDADAPAAGATINDLLDLDPITFAVNSAEITPEGKAVLAAAVEFMNGNPDVSVEIGGHTDSDGNDAFNQELSQSRADSVKAFLEAEGVDGDRMTTKGYGEAEPKVDNDTDENKAINRRIEFTIQ